ncbi:MAG: hypothetical protein GF334_05470 [Candidatus Altiarchaeales archaeon]|nr:hypothetical protein [Candidatus Altiarchaeales archaeon]
MASGKRVDCPKMISLRHIYRVYMPEDDLHYTFDDLILVVLVDDNKIGAKVLASFDEDFYNELYTPYQTYLYVDWAFTEYQVEDLPLFISYPYTSPLYRQTLDTLQIPGV